MRLSDFWHVLPIWTKGAILAVLLGATVVTGLTVYKRYNLNVAHQKEEQATRERAQAELLRAQATKFTEEAAKLQAKYDKAVAKSDKLQKELEDIKIPAKVTAPPEKLAETIADLKIMGLELVQKPSVLVKPCVVGLTSYDAGQVWLWGKESLRVAPMEVKLVKQGELIAVLEKSRDLAISIAETKGKEADTYHQVADLHQKEADNLRIVVADTRKALSAEEKKKYLYAAGAALGTYLVVKH